MRVFCLVVGFCVLFGQGLAEGGSIRGVVSVQVAAKQAKPKRYYMGPYRSGLRMDDTPMDGPMNTVVYLAGLAGMPDSLTFRPDPLMVQQDERFVPHVLPVKMGTAVGFPNQDDFYHNVFSVVSGDRFDLGRYAQGETTYQKFEKAGVVVVVRCEIHPSMKAYVLVLDTDFFTVPKDNGTYLLTGVPAGTYQLTVWHPERAAQSRTVSVPETGEAVVDFSF